MTSTKVVNKPQISKTESKKLMDLLLNKSQEAFLLSIELFNKPTISLNVECFVIFMSNAWEQLLKAYLLKNNENIYYKKSGTNKNRSYSLTALIQKTMTNMNDPVRINLEIVVGLRNFASHLIVPEYASLFNDVFLSCVRNYTEKLNKYFDININDRFNTDFLTLHIPTSNSNVDLIGKYGKEIFRKYNATSIYLNRKNIELSDDKGNVPETFAISYSINVKKVKNIDEADVTMYNAKNTNSIPVVKITTLTDPNTTHPLKASDIITRVNERLKLTGISFTPYTLNKNTKFTMDSFKLICIGYNLKKQKEYAYCHNYNNVYTYSNKVIEFIINTIQNDPEVFIKIKNGDLKKKD